MTRRVLVVAVALAAAGPVTTDIFDAETGARQGRIVEGPTGSLDLFNVESQRRGWGKTDATGTQLFAPDGSRIGTFSRDGKTLWLNRPAPGKSGKR